MKYIALLRGINVSGQKMIKMKDLIKVFESLGFINIKTYLQSGNVIFEHEVVDILELTDKIENKIIEAFGFTVKTIILTNDELESIINSNPLLNGSDIDQDKLHVTFLSEKPEQSKLDNLEIKKEIEEKFMIILKEVYLYCPNGYGRTKLNNAVFEKKLKVIATTRSWKTVKNIFDLSKQDID
jgi:uncharacterized protein (DUF1697 family)